MVSAALVWELTKRDFTERFAGSLLGSVWSFILPLVNLLIYFIVFSKLMGSRLPGESGLYAYGVYLSVGLIPWTAFANSISRGSSVFLDKKSLISKVRISLPSLLLYINLSETITFTISASILSCILLILGHDFNRHMAALPLVFYLQALFTFGFGLMAAVLTVFVRDLKEMVGVLMQLWFWFTPIVYVRDILPDMAKSLLALNPAYVIIDSYQRIVVYGVAPSYVSLAVLSVVTHALILAAYVIFRRLERDVRDCL